MRWQISVVLSLQFVVLCYNSPVQTQASWLSLVIFVLFQTCCLHISASTCCPEMIWELSLAREEAQPPSPLPAPGHSIESQAMEALAQGGCWLAWRPLKWRWDFSSHEERLIWRKIWLLQSKYKNMQKQKMLIQELIFHNEDIYLPKVGYYSRHWNYNSEQNRPGPCPDGPYSIRRG